MKKGTGVVAVLALVVASGFFFVSGMQESHNSTCETLTQIAKDDQKMRYVKAWLASRMTDKQFMDAVGQGGSFPRADPRTATYINLDWRRLGLTPDLAWVEFNVEPGEPDPKQVTSVSLNQGRSSIIFSLRPSTDLGLGWPADEMKKIKHVGDDVFVYCQYSH